MLLMFIVYSNAVDEEIVEISKRYASGYTKFLGLQGEGNKEPHLGSHIWPSINNCIMVAVENDKKDDLIRDVEELKFKFKGVGVSIFITQLKQMI